MLYYQIIILLILLAIRLSVEVLESYIHAKGLRLTFGLFLLMWLFTVLVQLVDTHILKVYIWNQ